MNGETALTVSVTKLPIDSRYAKIMRVMQEAEANRPRMRRIADRLGAWYTVLGVGVGLVGWMIGHDPTRFLAVLVIATPCPLLLAIPVAIIGAISVAASRGIIVKDPAMLERIGSCRTVIFDKTGTLTYGKPSLTDILCAPNMDRKGVLQMAASLEQYSKHPLAGSVLEAARLENVDLIPVSQISEKPGQGLGGTIGAKFVQITGRKAVLRRRRSSGATSTRCRRHGMHPAPRRTLCGDLSLPRCAETREWGFHRSPRAAPPGSEGDARVGRSRS